MEDQNLLSENSGAVLPTVRTDKDFRWTGPLRVLGQVDRTAKVLDRWTVGPNFKYLLNNLPYIHHIMHKTCVILRINMHNIQCLADR